MIESVFTATGFAAFLQGLPANLDVLLNTHNVRSRASGIVTSATLALAEAAVAVNPLARAAALIKSAWQIYADLKGGRFVVDRLRGEALEMRQYLNCFGTSVSYDGRGFSLCKSANTSTISVMVLGRMYILEFGPGYEDASLSEIEARLYDVWQLATKELRIECDTPNPSAITSLEHREQVALFNELAKDGRNHDALERVRDSFLTVCLEVADNPSSTAAAFREAHQGNPYNRWFHSALQIVVFGNARACVIFNFNAYIDGNVMMRVAAEMHRRSFCCIQRSGGTSPIAKIRRLRWQVPPGILNGLRSTFVELTDDQETSFTLDRCGKARFEKSGLKAVPAFHCALQLAACRLFGRPVRIAEMLSRSRYRYIGVIATPIISKEIDDLLRHWSSTEPHGADRQRLLLAASAAYEKICRQARSSLNIKEAMELFRLSLTESQRGVFNSMMRAAMAYLRKEGRGGPSGEPEIIVSHPAIFPEVPLVGRPGSKTPYLRCFAMHYQILDEQISITLIRATKCIIPCSEIVSVIESYVAEVLSSAPDDE